MWKRRRTASLSGSSRVAARGERLGDASRLQRRPQIAGGETMQAARLRAEAAADPLARQSEKRLHRPDTELVQAVAQRRVDAQPTEPHPSRQHPFGSAIGDHRHRLAGREGPGDRLGAEPREPDRNRRPKAARLERRHDLPRPPAERRMEAGQPRGVQPEDPRLLAGRLDIGAEPVQAPGNRRDTALDVGGRHLAGVQGVRQRQAGAVAHPGPDAGRACLPVHPQDHALRLVAIDHRHRPAGPVGMALEQELQWELGQLNARHPVHDTTPRRAIPDRGACP